MHTRCRQNGKPLVVKFADGVRHRNEHKLYVSNLPADMDEEHILKLFAQVCDPISAVLRRRLAVGEGLYCFEHDGIGGSFH